MQFGSTTELNAEAATAAVRGTLLAQVTQKTTRTTKTGKPPALLKRENLILKSCWQMLPARFHLKFGRLPPGIRILICWRRLPVWL